MSVVITGVSQGGIGAALATYFMKQGFHVFGGVRKLEDVEHLQKVDEGTFTPLIFDATDADAVTAAARVVSKALLGRTLSALINNAGVCISPHPLIHMPLELVRRQLEINLVAQVQVIQAFAPLLGADSTRKGKPGRIVNMSSVYGNYSLPFMGPYCASKAALERLSDALRLELRIFGIRVITIRPGPIKTAIWQKAVQHKPGTGSGDWHAYDDTAYATALAVSKRYLDRDNATPGKQIDPEHVARTAFKAVTTEHPKSYYLVTGDWFVNWFVPFCFPRHLVDKDICRRFGLRKLRLTNGIQAHAE